MPSGTVSIFFTLLVGFGMLTLLLAATVSIHAYEKRILLCTRRHARVDRLHWWGPYPLVSATLRPQLPARLARWGYIPLVHVHLYYLDIPHGRDGEVSLAPHAYQRHIRRGSEPFSNVSVRGGHVQFLLVFEWVIPVFWHRSRAHAGDDLPAKCEVGLPDDH